MTTSRFLSSLVVALVLTGCGSDEPHEAAPPPPAAQKPATPPAAAANKPAAAAPAGPPQSACVGKWTTGTTGTLTCSAPGKDATFDKAAFRLDRVCVNDPRITTYTVAGKAVTMTLKPEGKQLCATFSGVAEVPESCSCVAPAAGDCTPPSNGFVCVALGHSAPAGG